MRILMKKEQITLLATVLSFVTLSLKADPIPVSNFSFESPTGSAPNGLFDPDNGSIGAWQYSRTGVLAATLTDVTFDSWGTATDGSNAASLTFLAGVAAEVSIFQDLGTSFLSNSLYTLTFDAGQASAVSLLSGASASIFAGGTPVATLSGATLISLLDLNGDLSGFTLEFTTGEVAPVGNVGIEFSAGGVAEVIGSGLVVDNVNMTVTPVPEPGSAMLIGMTGLWLLINRRRRL
jgi:hypothetical protein